MWWHVPVTPAFGKLVQESEASPGYMRPYLKVGLGEPRVQFSGRIARVALGSMLSACPIFSGI